VRLVLALVLMLPSAAALDALPDEARFAAHEARLVVRVAEGASLHVATDTAALVALAGGDFTPTPAVLAVPSDASWHGLERTVELQLRRSDASSQMRIELDDRAGTGAVFTWPPQREVPGAGVAGVLSLLACLVIVSRASGCARGRPSSRHSRASGTRPT